MMSNINRDYLIINDVKKSNVKLDNGSMFFYITDKNTQNIFVNLVINVSKNELIQKFANIENAEDYTLTMNIVKPDNTYKVVEGKLHDKENAIFEFDLKEDCCDEIGTYKCELLTKCNINDHEEITTSNKLTYKVKSSVLNDLDDIVEAPEYPLVIQLFDKLSDIEQHEEDRRANELARQLAEEQRQARFNALDSDMVDRITAMDDKMVDVENRVSTKEQAVDKLINDTKADIDEYKVAKDQEIDDYKTAKDQQINEAITAQDNKIDEAISNQNDRITVVENNVVAQNNKLDVLENKDTLHESRLEAIEVKNVEQDNRLNEIEAIDVAQNSRLDAIEVKNQQQDDRLLDIEKVNKRQDMDLKCLFAESKNNMIDVTEEGNSIYLQNSTVGYTLIDEIQGNTMVNCNKEPDKEIILNGNINTQGYSNITLNKGVDGGLVDVALEGNTMVNVCDQKDPVAITKSYTVETGNHVALQGEYDGKCRPVVTGNTLVNLLDSNDFNFSSYYCTWDGFKINVNYDVILNVGNIDFMTYKGNRLVEGKTYTVIINLSGTYSQGTYGGNTFGKALSELTQGINKVVFTYSSSMDICKCWVGGNSETIDYTLEYLLILEGDYTDKPIPEYFEGLQSSFEDKVVTQEMVDNGEELAENLGKYRVDYKVTGKNKFDINYGHISDSSAMTVNNNIISYNGTGYADIQRWVYLYKGVTYKFSYTSDTGIGGADLLRGKRTIWSSSYLIKNLFNDNAVFTVDETGWYTIHIAFSDNITSQVTDIQLEEGSVATPYEPYKEYKKTFYLNSPLLEGDNIEQQGDNVVHVHRSDKVVLDGSDDEGWAIDTSYSNDTLILFVIRGFGASYIDGMNVGICDKLLSKATWNGVEEGIWVDKNFILTLRKSRLTENTLNGLKSYLSSNPLTVAYKLATPQYEVISQNDSILCDSYVNGHLDVDSVVPIEKVDFLSFKEDLTYLYANTQYAVQFVSDAVSKVDITLGGAELLNQNVVVGTNKYTITTPSELIDNNLVLNGEGFNASNIVVTEATDRDFGYFEGMKSVGECEELEVVSSNSDGTLSNTQTLTHEPLRAVGNIKDKYVLIDGKWYIERNCAEVVLDGSDDEKYVMSNELDSTVRFTKDKDPSYRVPTNGICDKLISFSNIGSYNHDVENIRVENDSQLYIRINKSKLTDISSAGFKTWLQSNPLTIVTALKTPQYEPIEYNPFEVYSDITHISNNSTIPCNMTIKNTGYNCLLKPNTTYTVSSNLGLNIVTTPSVLTEDCLRFYDTDTSDVTTMKDVLVLEGDYTTGKPLPSHFSGIESAFEQEYDEGKGKYRVNIKVANEDKSQENNITFYIDEPLRGTGTAKDRVFIQGDKVVVERKCGVRAYQDGDFGTYLTDKVNTVYPLAEPTYEEVEYNDVKLFIELFKNSTLSYNSNVPVTSKLYYSYSVPIVDTVAQTANVTDQQDNMIIDLATQVAVMEMMLM